MSGARRLLARRPWWVIGLWLFLLAAANPLGARFHDSVAVDDLSVHGSESAEGQEVLDRAGLEAPRETDVLVFEADHLTVADFDYQLAVEQRIVQARRHPEVTLAISPYDAPTQVSADGRTSFAVLGLAGTPKEVRDALVDLQDEVRASDGPVRAVLTGETAIALDVDHRGRSDIAKAELYGFPIAFALLLLAFGSLVAAALPLGAAAISVSVTLGVLGIVATWTDFAPLTENVATIIGLGLGVDFSMFVVSRFREQSASGLATEDAVETTLDTTGRAVRHSAAMVVVALLGLLIVRNDIFRDITFGAVVVTVVSALVSLTFLPAVLTVLGPRIDAGPSFRRATERDRWRSYATTVVRRRVPAAVLALVVIGVLAVPLLSLRLGLDRSSGVPDDLPAGRGLDLLDEQFSSGLLTPVEVVVSSDARLDAGALTAIDEVTREVEARDDVASVVSPTGLLRLSGLPLTPEGLAQLAEGPHASPLAGAVVGERTAVLFVVTRAHFDSAEANGVVRDLRRDVTAPLRETGLHVHTSGATASTIDLIAEVHRATPLVIAYLLIVSFLVLSVLLRAPVAAAKAVLMNLLGVVGAYGLLVWGFQDGHLSGVLGLDGPVAIQAYLPVLALAVLFGISMDYEVFLLARVREEWLRTGDANAAVVDGLARSGRSITLAAGIQVAVFGAFALTSVIDVQQVGFALAAAILLDATLVRVLLAPALMGLLGRWNWVGVPRVEPAGRSRPQ